MFCCFRRNTYICNILTSKPHSAVGKCGHAVAGRYVWIPYMEKAFITRFVLDFPESLGNLSETVNGHGNDRCSWVCYMAALIVHIIYI